MSSFATAWMRDCECWKATTLPPDQIDEGYNAPRPGHRPQCGGRHLAETHTVVHYQIASPRRPIYRAFTIHFRRCADCRPSKMT